MMRTSHIRQCLTGALRTMYGPAVGNVTPVLLCLLCLISPCAADESSDATTLAARRILQTRCVSCHGADKQEGGLRLDTAEFLQKGGDRAAAQPSVGESARLLLLAISWDDADFQMPPKQRLSERETAILRTWMQTGAAWGPAELPGGLATPVTPDVGDAFSDPGNPVRQIFGEERLELWSLKAPVESDPLPAGEHPVDAILSAELERSGLSLSSEADRRTLIRRVTLDLTGLLPTPEEVDSYCQDTAPDAWQRVVDRLLDSQRYGERQARLWLDVVRYADTNGYERDEFRPLIWKYRDYVIRALNSDKPFDQFVREQVAGDELVQGQAKTAAQTDMLIATGFLRLGQWDSTASIFQEEERLLAEVQADLTNTTASAFLGLTMSCCQCHDHKYDPLTQADHYRMRAFFASMVPRDDLVISTQQQQKDLQQRNEQLDSSIAALRQQLQAAENSKHEQLTKEIQDLETQKTTPELAMGVADRDSGIPATHILSQGDHASPGPTVEPGFPSFLDPHPASISLVAGSSGRRLTLAEWIVSPQNPWTARVFVNRLWQQHFGTGLIATPNDLGFTGARPVHQRLLDMLANEFLRRQWSVKAMHRLILTSAAYRQTSLCAEVPPAHPDPENHLFWRQNVRRLDAESLRDCLLQVSGLLQTYDSGPPRWPPVPEELRYAQPAILEAEEGKDDGRRQGWYANEKEDADVRSIFLIRKRCLPIPFLQVFDLPDSTTSCGRRDETIVAPQAIMLLNSPDTARYSKALAGRLIEAAPHSGPGDRVVSEEAAVEMAFRLIFQRMPDAEESDSCRSLIGHIRRNHDNKPQKPSHGLTEMCRALLNTNEFLYID